MVAARHRARSNLTQAYTPHVIRTPTALLLSNGHGEDVIAVRLARALARERPDLDIRAFPTVGMGSAFTDAPVTLLDPRQTLPSGGLTMTSPRLLQRDLRAGLLALTLQQFHVLRRERPDFVLTVGDAWLEALGLLPRAKRRYAVQTLVSVHLANRERTPGIMALRERITWVERTILTRGYQSVYVRDPATRDALAPFHPRVRALGTPMMDDLDASPLPLDTPGPRILLLPGSRANATDVLAVMRAALQELESRYAPLDAVVAWAGPSVPGAPEGWTVQASPVAEVVWQRGGIRLHVTVDRFAAALAWADVVLGVSGTAVEQAAGRGRPIVSFEAPPFYDARFLARQARLLDGALEIVPNDATAISAALRSLIENPDLRRQRGERGRERMGPSGAAQRIARDVLHDAGLLAGGAS